jgi:predicted nucleotide-binding protein (sugar kinase/HSP70/actin superfamily)
MADKTKIGIPRAMLYHKYGVFWQAFLPQLGFDVVVSPETNKEILKKGASLAIDESCLSLKIYLGHVDWLLPKVDYIFIPRIVSLKKNENLCTKFMALGDISRNTFKGIKIIEYTIDITKNRGELFAIFMEFLKWEKNPIKIINAYFSAKNIEHLAKEKALKKQAEKIKDNNDKKPAVLLVSHPYTTYDVLLGKPIISFLESQGIDIIFADIAPKKETMELSKKISRDLYWTYNKELIGAIEYYKDNIDGIIFLMVFPCGPDALVVNLCQHKLKNLPLSVITLDELEGDAGLKTRLESFADILKIKKSKNGRTK